MSRDKTVYRFLLICCMVIIGLSGAGYAQESQTDAETTLPVRVYVTNFKGDGISVIDPVEGQLVKHIKTGQKPHGVAVSPDGKRVYVTNEGDGTLSVIDPVKNEVFESIPVGSGPNQLEVSPDGKRIFVTLNGDDAIAVLDAGNLEVIKKVAGCRGPHIVRHGPENKIYATCERDMKLAVIDAETLEVIDEIPLFAWPRVLTSTLDNSKLFLTIRWLNGVLVIDPSLKKVTGRILLSGEKFAESGMDAHGIETTPDGKELWVATQTNGIVTILRANNLESIGEITVGTNPNWIAFSPDGRWAAVSNTGSGTVSIIDTARRQVVHEVKVGASPKRLTIR